MTIITDPKIYKFLKNLKAGDKVLVKIEKETLEDDARSGENMFTPVHNKICTVSGINLNFRENNKVVGGVRMNELDFDLYPEEIFPAKKHRAFVYRDGKIVEIEN